MLSKVPTTPLTLGLEFDLLLFGGEYCLGEEDGFLPLEFSSFSI